MEKEKQRPSKNKKLLIILWGLLIHFLILFAVFDIYFSSPLDHGMQSIKSILHPPAKRLVLFVADGLRAEAVIEKNTHRIPFLNQIIQSHGSWGIANTRVPTESRPGHVALLAGIYEDPSAILKGWKANPVYFDSVINQSRNSWCWGSPDIINIFNKDGLSHIHLYTYSKELQDFGENNTGLLDDWVFSNVDMFLNREVKSCENNCDRFKSSGNVFFLHLLGIDTAGHGFKPHSNEYINNIKLVDTKVHQISALFNDIYQDNATTFVFTADHGMTDWGSHGAGSSHETKTPFIAWGAGIKKNPKRQDINQIDIAPFLSTTIGINIPSNSLGIIPLEYFDLPKEQLAEIALSNTLQLLEIFNVKRLRTEANAYIFLPYKGLTTKLIMDKVSHLKKIQEDKQFSELIDDCRKLMEVIISGLEYYHNYYRYPLLICISIGFIGWILFLVASVFDNQSVTNRSTIKSNTILATINIVPLVLCYMQRFPLSYYLHFSFPFLIITMFYYHLIFIFQRFWARCRILDRYQLTAVSIYILGVELLVYGFFNRISFSILIILIGLWIFLPESFGKYVSKNHKFFWISLCIIISIFPLFPVMKTSFNFKMYLLGCIAWIVLFYESYYRLVSQNQFRSTNEYKGIYLVQFFCMLLAALQIIVIELELISNNSTVKYFSWILFIIPILLIPFSSRSIPVRLVTTVFGFAPFYLLVSSNYDTVFSAVYVATLCNWLFLESKSFQASSSTNIIYYSSFTSYIGKEKVNSDMFRRAFLFMVFIFIGFFGTGNIASLNSFDPMWVRAFITVFSPFKMMGLIFVKIMVPFIFSCCVFRAINSIGKEDILQMFCIILIFSDIMVLQFLFLITNKGSWLDIGTSLSHFIIMEGFVIILLLLYGCAHLITTARYFK